MTALLILFLKLVSYFSKILGLGNGSTWPGHIALSLNPNIISDILRRSDCKIIVVTGTNGKTTTSRMISHILMHERFSILKNDSGANLLNGIASTILLSTNMVGKLSNTHAVFEVDENALPHVLKQCKPDVLVVLNLFRDQLDRYGEVRAVAKKWQEAIKSLPKETTLLLNADDPEVSYLSSFSHHQAIKTFGLDYNSHIGDEDITADSTSCPKCGTKLSYTSRVYSHIGVWKCTHCKLGHKNPTITQIDSYPLSGTYNKYNTHAAVLTSIVLGVPKNEAVSSLTDLTPAFGRQEKIEYKGKTIQLFLSKNPAGFNQSLETIMESNPHSLLFVLNDRIPDGTDVSWIWDTDIERFNLSKTDIYASGDRAFDMGLRLKYAEINMIIEPDLKIAIEKAVRKLPKDQVLYIIPTYSAMLEVRKIITGKKIL